MTKFYGLTGGIGSGKSTVAAMFANLGVPTLDLDHVGKIVVAQEPKLLQQLIQAFGTSILYPDKSLNRKQLAQYVFQDEQHTQLLNSIIHPHIHAYEQVWRAKQSTPLALIEASVLIEAGATKRMDGLWVVLADLDLRWQRVKHRGQQTQTSFKHIVQRQCSDQERKTLANVIFYNNGSIAQLQSDVQHFITQLNV